VARRQIVTEPEWLSDSECIIIHDVLITELGGLGGFPNPGYLSSAIAAPRQTFNYDGGVDLFDLAAVYIFHIAKAHAFSDGNKRTAYVTGLYFLHQNGIDLMQPEDALELAAAVVAAAEADTLNKPDLASLLRDLASRHKAQTAPAPPQGDNQ
jgi:death-on-curing protein